jgi:hypothetical protein
MHSHKGKILKLSLAIRTINQTALMFINEDTHIFPTVHVGQNVHNIGYTEKLTGCPNE